MATEYSLQEQATGSCYDSLNTGADILTSCLLGYVLVLTLTYALSTRLVSSFMLSR